MMSGGIASRPVLRPSSRRSLPARPPRCVHPWCAPSPRSRTESGSNILAKMEELETALRDTGPTREEKQQLLAALHPSFFDPAGDCALQALQSLPANPTADASECIPAARALPRGWRARCGPAAGPTAFPLQCACLLPIPAILAVEKVIENYQGVLDIVGGELADHVLANYDEFVEGGDDGEAIALRSPRKRRRK